MVDQPEVFFSPQSPCKGAKPEDLAAIADQVRAQFTAAPQDFVDKFDVLDMALQVEVRDSVNGDVVGATVMQRGASAAGKKPIGFDALMATATDLGERFACRMDNSNVPPDRRIDCSDPSLRKARPRLR
jgi:hypothetical protein